MGNYGVKVSPAGTAVDSVTDIAARFTSKFPYLQAYLFGTTTVTLNSSGNATVTIAHNLGFAPAYDVFVTKTAGFSFLTGTTYANAWTKLGGSNRWFETTLTGGLFAYTDSTNLYIQGVDSYKSQTITVKYYLYPDPIQAFSGASSVSDTGDYGMKVSKDGYNVLSMDESKKAFSSKYKTMQYFDESIKSANLTLPEMWASFTDTDVEEATYVDFAHGLGYAPYFLAYFTPSGTIAREIPYMEDGVYYESGPGYYNAPYYEVSAWCDATRIRVTFWRRSSWLSPDLSANAYWSGATITVRVVPFAEPL